MTLRPGRRALTADEWGFLAQCAVLIGTATNDADRDLAIATAVAAARRYRQEGVGWEEIADALGMEPAELRDWRGGASGVRKPAAGGRPRVAMAPRLQRRRGWTPAVLRWTALVATGNAKVNGNDFAGEAAVIRQSLQPFGMIVIERFNIEIAEIRRELDESRPAVLHLAAHADFGAVHLSLDGAASGVLHTDLHRAIRSATVRPTLVVLNCCDSEMLARNLAALGAGGDPGVEAAVGWHGAVTDEQAQVFAGRLYRGLATASTIGQPFDDAHLTVTARWPDQAIPRLFGNAAVSLLPPDR